MWSVLVALVAQPALASSPGDLAFAVPLTAYDDARCLDGSVARYYLRRGARAGAFYVHQQGGGFCTSLADCEKRAQTYLGSTLANVSDPWEPTLNLTEEQPAFSTDASQNPLLHDFSHVYVVYCDGAYFSGDRRGTVAAPGGAALHFKGKKVLDAVLADLADRHALAEVVLGGCSAGGIAVYMHLDYVARSLAALAPEARVVGFADSGFYANVPFYTDQKKFPYEASNITSATLSARCVADHAEAPWECLVAEVNAPYVEAPLFAWQSKFDADQLATSFDPPCTTAACAGPYAARLLAGVRAFAAGGRGRGAFVDSCHRHCDRADPGHDVRDIAASQTTPLRALRDWYEGATIFVAQPAPGGYPCDSCC